MPNHPSIGREVSWTLVGSECAIPQLQADIRSVETIGEAQGDALITDWMAASYKAPCVRPRQHAVVLRVRDPNAVPQFVLVTAAYPVDAGERPHGLAMVEAEGRSAGDAVVIARGAGMLIDSIIVLSQTMATMAKNEALEPDQAANAFFAAAIAAIAPTLKTPTK